MQAFFAEKNSIKADGIAARGPATAAKLNALGFRPVSISVASLSRCRQ
jgi:uroporphyrinogen-III synthase